jgi:hypothetical protein
VTGRHTACHPAGLRRNKRRRYAYAVLDRTLNQRKRSVSKRGNFRDAAINDLALAMRGMRDFRDNEPYDPKAPAMWQLGYRSAIRSKVRDEGPLAINLKQRLLISRARPRFAALRRSA